MNPEQTDAVASPSTMPRLEATRPGGLPVALAAALPELGALVVGLAIIPAAPPARSHQLGTSAVPERVLR
jgi:hypothetical protein